MVDQLSNVERAPQRRMMVEQRDIGRKNSALTTLKNELTGLKTNAKALKETSLYDARSVSSNETHTTAAAEEGTSSGDYRFEVYQLATAAKQLGNTDVGASVTTSTAMDSAGFAIAVTEGPSPYRANKSPYLPATRWTPLLPPSKPQSAAVSITPSAAIKSRLPTPARWYLAAPRTQATCFRPCA